MGPQRRRDVVVGAVLAVTLVGTATVAWRFSPAAGVSSVTAVVPISVPPAATAVPVGFLEAWRAPSSATPAPVVAGPAVVTGDASAVVGRDARNGREAWHYTRDRPLCTVGAGFPAVDGGIGRVLALYGSGDYCSELTTLRPDTGLRGPQRNPDLATGTRLLENGTFVAATGPDYLEVVRSDLVQTLEFGAVTTPQQPGRQPRSGCGFRSFALTAGRLGVIERCPGEPTDRLTVLSPDGASGSEQPQQEFSVPLPAAAATLVALSADRAAVALRDPPRLLILDKAGLQVGLIGLDVPDADLANAPPGGVAPVTVGSAGQRYWWTGSRTIALDPAGLAPVWTLAGTLGAGISYAERLLIPVPAGLLVVDPVRGVGLRTLPVGRPDRTAPVSLAALGEVVLEQRGAELVALRPAP